MTESYKTLLVDIDEDGSAVVTVNRPEKLNALNNLVLDELEKAFSSLKENRSVQGVILTGAGDKAFAAGADISELRNLNSSLGKKAALKGQSVFSAIENFPKPVIAAVNGYALGGGAELAMACHLRVSSVNAVFGFPEVSLGLIPGYGGTQRLPLLIGRGRALEYILTADKITADQAEKIGLVNRVTGKGEAVDASKVLLGMIAKNGPVALAGAIRAVNVSGGEKGYEKEAELFGGLCGTEDFREGTAAFAEKRQPVFRGR
ncbi:MAG: enoyl-CoA hydratase-related protein [Balneolaceae bacterium]